MVLQQGSPLAADCWLPVLWHPQSFWLAAAYHPPGWRLRITAMKRSVGSHPLGMEPARPRYGTGQLAPHAAELAGTSPACRALGDDVLVFRAAAAASSPPPGSAAGARAGERPAAVVGGGRGGRGEAARVLVAVTDVRAVVGPSLPVWLVLWALWALWVLWAL